MNNQNKVFLMVDRDELKEIVEESIRKTINNVKSTPKEEVMQLGKYIPQSEAMKILNRKTTWFHLKRKSGELVAKKSANQWWYRREDLENYVSKGLDSNGNY